MHVDGFRFDLAPVLARTSHEVDRHSPFFSAIQQDPVISQVKLIAEPWDVGDAGYQVGNFPAIWSEWNDQFRDCVRDYWRGHNHMSRQFSLRLAGSPDLYGRDRRRPSASINFIASHDGFTLADLVSYNDKHNLMNGECNMDGHTDNRSWNCGAEGITSDFDINALRAQQQRNLLATVMLSQGVPMLLAGDELGRTQCGNNNAYCQDNDMSWIDWERMDHAMLAFVRQLIALRQAHPVFRKRRFACTECTWYRNDGHRMTSADWDTPWAKAIATYLAGSAADVPDNDFYIAFNPHFEPLPFTIPVELGDDWQVALHTSRVMTQPVTMHDGTLFRVGAHSLLVLSRKSRNVALHT
jgi:glycogen operon protein